MCCYKLLSLNVGIRNVGPVIHTVLNSIAHKSVSRLPSYSSLCRMITEGLSVAEMQLGEKLTEEGSDNFTLQMDGTTKYGPLIPPLTLLLKMVHTPLDYVLFFLGLHKIHLTL